MRDKYLYVLIKPMTDGLISMISLFILLYPKSIGEIFHIYIFIGVFLQMAVSSENYFKPIYWFKRWEPNSYYHSMSQWNRD